MAITSKDILSFNFYTYKQPFTGSCQGMRYRIVRMEVKPESGEQSSTHKQSAVHGQEPEEQPPEVFFRVSVWKEPYAYEHTPKEEILNQDFPFDPEGYEQVLAWLNERLAEMTHSDMPHSDN